MSSAFVFVLLNLLLRPLPSDRTTGVGLFLTDLVVFGGVEIKGLGGSTLELISLIKYNLLLTNLIIFQALSCSITSPQFTLWEKHFVLHLFFFLLPSDEKLTVQPLTGVLLFPSFLVIFGISDTLFCPHPKLKRLSNYQQQLKLGFHVVMLF